MISIQRQRLQLQLRSSFAFSSSLSIPNRTNQFKVISSINTTSRHPFSTFNPSFQHNSTSQNKNRSNSGHSHIKQSNKTSPKLQLKPAPIRPRDANQKSISKPASNSNSASTSSRQPIKSGSNLNSFPSTKQANSKSATSSQSSTSASSSSSSTSSDLPSTAKSSTSEATPESGFQSSSDPPQSIAEKAKAFIYTLRLFFRFYFRGVKQIWWDSRKISAIRSRSRLERSKQSAEQAGEGQSKVTENANSNASEIGGIKWGEAALIRSHHHDLLCLPLFLILLVLLEEAIPLIVIFAPALLPTTCLLESQREGIRRGEEVNRSKAWERLSGLNVDRLEKSGASARAEIEKQEQKDWKIDAMSLEELKDFSHVFSLPSYGPSFLLRYRLRKRLEFLQKDDVLLLQASKEPASSPDGMSTEREVLAKAAGERGLRASGISATALRHSLFSYLSKISAGASDGIPSTLALSVPISLYDTTDLTSLRKYAQEQASRGVFAQAKDVMNSVLKEEKEREAKEKEQKDAASIAEKEKKP